MRETGIAVRSSNGSPEEAILLTVEFREYSGQWLTECLELGTATYADSLEKARQEIGESIILQLGSVEELGFVEEYLREHNVPLLPLKTPSGRRKEAATWSSPTLVSA
jgi:hypothetical protein